MAFTASIRDLRNKFPRIRKLLHADGEVLLTEGGKIRYRLVAHTLPTKASPPAIDYWARLTAYQPAAISAAQARLLRDDNRDER